MTRTVRCRILRALECVSINMSDSRDAAVPGPEPDDLDIPDDFEGASEPDNRGVYDARYLAFLETIVHLRPSLHRYCSRMTGSVLDGEDVVQDALFLAYRKLDTFDDSRRLGPWLFRIAHNRCIDFLRRRDVRRSAEAEAAVADAVAPVEPPGPMLDRAVEHLVLALPPKERACVLLKDVFDYSLDEIAALVGSTSGGVKAALNRGRSKLAALASRAGAGARAKPSPEMTQLLHLYVERFNQRDWDSLRELIADDARLLVADRFSGPLVDSPYFGRYQRWSAQWQLAVGTIDEEPAIFVMQRRNGGPWAPTGVVRLEVATDQHATHQHIHRICDFQHCPWVLKGATSLVIGEAQPA